MTAIIINKILPIILIYLMGFLLKKLSLFDKKDGALFLKIVFNIGLPALIIISFSEMEINSKLYLIPLSAAIVFFSTFIFAKIGSNILNIRKKDKGVFLIGSIIMNIGFVLPFFISVYGQKGLARISFFNFANGILVMSFAYITACKYGENDNSYKNIAKKVLTSPPIWAIVIGILLNYLNITVPVFADKFLSELGNLVAPLTMLALGIYFTPKFKNLKISIAAVFIRTFLGLLFGIFLVKLFGLEGLNKITVIVGASAPIGYNTLTFSTMEKLNKELAASIVSVSIIFSLFFVPFLIIYLN